tara:strand:- start:614 stop:2617 length:2004 start_codon:yes stop_codon:yes gene_type:complete
MSFIANIFLWLLPLVSIPLIIHLLNRRKIVEIPFGNIQFLNQLKTDSIKRINILQWLLLLIRTFIILLIIFMMARPILKGYYPALKINPESSLSIIFIDNSFSMHGVRDNISREKILIESYNRLLASFNDNSRIAVFSSNDGLLYGGLKSDLPSLNSFFKIHNSNSQLYLHIKTMQEKFSKKIINKELFIISDGQSTLMDNVDYDDIDDWKIYFILLEQMQSNLKINKAFITNSILTIDKPLEFCVEVENNGLSAVTNKSINLFVNDVNVGIQNISLDSSQKKNIYFKTTLPKYGANIIRVSISDDDNVKDNSYYLNAFIPERINILSIFENVSNCDYVFNAIETINNKDFTINHKKVSIESFNLKSLIDYDVIIIYDYNIFEDLYNVFEEYFYDNKHLIILPDLEDNVESLYAIMGIEDSEKKYINLAPGYYETVLYRDFFENQNISEDSQDFLKVFKYVEQPINQNSKIFINKLYSFWDRFFAFNSQVDIFYSSLHLSWNELPVRGIFIQFLKELFYSNLNTSSYNGFVGEEISFELNNSDYVKKTIIHESPEGKRLNIVPDNSIVDFIDISDIGIHNFYNNSKEKIHSIAINASNSELSSDLLMNEEIQHNRNNIYFLDINSDFSSDIVKAREGYEVWRYILLIICFLVFLEMFLSNNEYRKAD